MSQPSHFIAGRWVEGRGEPFESLNPATDDGVWRGRSATADDVGEAVRAARAASEAWANLTVEERGEFLRAFGSALEARKSELAETISRETGKPLWESLGEVAAMIAKVPLTLEAYAQRTSPSEQAIGDAKGAVRYKPHGAVAVFGPFNLPGHLPNGHVVPALLAGNTVVFKPSELTPASGRVTVECWEAAGLPGGVINLVQGARPTGEALARHEGIDGLLFTGGTAGGVALRRALADHPEKILALEMGGNNPLIVHEVADLGAAAYETVQSAFLTAGQRCSCARRLIAPRGDEGDRFVERLVETIARVKVGPYTDRPEPFMGPVISKAAADRLLEGRDELVKRGGRELARMERVNGSGAMLSPGLVDVTSVADRPDVEYFGPLLQLIRVADFDAAIDEANRTRFGLSAGLFSDRRENFERFFRRVRAGVVNWNRQLTNNSGRLPFGGVGLSGNHRPAGFFAVDYCSYPVASLEIDALRMPEKPTPGLAL